MRRASVLAAYAHPDDELFHGGGMLAHAAPRGARVTLACATTGEAGKVRPSVGWWPTLARCGPRSSANPAILGLGEPRFLGFHDSAREERQDDPRGLANVDMPEVEAAIRRAIEEVQPHVIVTFDPHGG